jgi:hypothetical protein
MDYQLKCICGHQFVISGERLRSAVHCPECGQRLTPVIQNTPPASAVTVTAQAVGALPPGETVLSGAPAAAPVGDGVTEPTKRCPFCGEVILAIARKCKHCGEFLDRTPVSPGGGTAGGMGGTESAATSLPAAAAADPVYALTTSQWDNFWRWVILFTAWVVVTAILYIPGLRPYMAVGSLGALVFAGFIGWYFYLRASTTRIRIFPLRIDVEAGILSRKLDSLELFRVNDTAFKQSFFERLLGIGTIDLMTSESTSEPELTLFQIPRAREVYKYLQTQIPIAARQRGAVYLEK